LVLSVFDDAGKLSNHRRINAMLQVHQNPTGQPWDKPEDDNRGRLPGQHRVTTRLDTSLDRPHKPASGLVVAALLRITHLTNYTSTP
jgi:hypothetical protein